MRRYALILLLIACQRSNEDNNTPKTTTIGLEKKPTIPQIKPKLDPKNPPADATKTSSGLVYKKLVENPGGKAPLRNDTVLINYTGWKSSDGSTFFTTESFGQPVPLNLSTTAAGFAEAMQLVKQGERVMLWIPPEIGYATPPQGKPEMLAYEVEIVGIESAPAVPPDLAAPPADAKPLKSGGKLSIIKPGSAEKPRFVDTVTFDYTAWDSTGRMFDSTEVRKRPAVLPPYKQSAAMEEVLTSLGKGARARLWIDSEKLQVGGKTANLPAGQLCYEIAIVDFEKAKGVPPSAPPDVKAPPADAKKSPKGVSYKILKAGKGGPKPGPTDRVKVIYTGWGTDGRMFDSSEITGQPTVIAINGAIAGWIDTVPLMSVGDKVRMWIPDELAYKGNPAKPQGMLVFDVELVEIMPPADTADPHGHGAPEKPKKPAPPDVAAPPKDAKKTASGLFYKILTAKKGAAHPKASDTVRVKYDGWQTNGNHFDGSETTEFALTRVIKGWTEGLQLMGVGEKARFWIPQELAYDGAEPSGMLVFDVELFEIKPSP